MFADLTTVTEGLVPIGELSKEIHFACAYPILHTNNKNWYKKPFMNRNSHIPNY